MMDTASSIDGRLFWMLVGIAVTAVPVPLSARTIHVAPGGTGDGSASDPMGSIGAALAAAQPGDEVVVQAGEYQEHIETQRDGLPEAPIVVRAEDGAQVIVSQTGEVLRVAHAHHRFEGLVLDGGFGDRDAVRVRTGADGLVLRNVEVRNSGRDCIDLGDVQDVLIQDSLVHHCLWATEPDCASDACRRDAHGIVAGAVRNLRIVGCEIHTFSGDGFQVDPDRSLPGWSDVSVEHTEIWLAPLPEAVAGFQAGVVPGENAVDTKTPDDKETPARLVLLDVTAHGFRGGLISNQAAFNLKENVEAWVDGVTVYDSHIAFRLRGATSRHPRGVQATILNAVVYDVDVAFRYEDDIQPVHVWFATIGSNVGRAFQRASAPEGVVDAWNVAFLGSSLPTELSPDQTNLAVEVSAFEDAPNGDYTPAADSPLLDAAEPLAQVDHDRAGVARPQGSAPDVGAYERCLDGTCGEPTGGDGGAGGTDGGPAGIDGDLPLDGAAGDQGQAASGCGCASEPAGGGLIWACLALLIGLRRRRPA